MDKQNYIDLFKLIASKNDIEIADDKLCESFYTLSNCLCEANKIHNLTAIKDEESIMLKHFIDSLFISHLIESSAKVIDIGCGPGFPSLPLAIYRPDISLFGIDSTSKKINYVNSTSALLGLSNMTAISCRAEELAHTDEYRESFDVATARAVASLPVLCELCLPFVKVGGTFIAMKAQSAEEELAASLSAISKCGGEYVKTETKPLVSHLDDVEDEKRSLIIIKKIKKSPEIYPRLYSKIMKKPL